MRVPCETDERPSMLTLLKITNFALIDELQAEFEPGLNLLTGETGSGKSIIVDALGVLIGGRFPSDMIKTGESRSVVEGLFSVETNSELDQSLERAGIEKAGDEILVRRETAAGRNKVFINNQLATQAFLREIRPFLVDIHGQGDQQTLLDPATHLELLDAYAGLEAARDEVEARFGRWAALRRELEEIRRADSEKLQLLDTLRFQADELERACLSPGEDEKLEEERRKLSNIEKLSVMCAEAFGLLYEETDSAFARIGQAARRVEELAEYDSSFRAHREGLVSALASIEDLAYTLRDFAGGLEPSPARLAQVEDRLAELSRLKRKYGGTIQAALEHLDVARLRLERIEQSDERIKELQRDLDRARQDYLKHAQQLHRGRVAAAKGLEKSASGDLVEVALENAGLEARIESPSEDDLANEDEHARVFTSRGIDKVEFYFSANVGEPPRPLAKVASGGEASRLMLVLKTITNAAQFPRTIVFDEIDSGIGGRVSEAVGAKLKRLSRTHQVLCVTHQAQIARFADCHLLVRKEVRSGATEVDIERLDRRGRVEEVARMLTGADITETARRHAREMLKIG